MQARRMQAYRMQARRMQARRMASRVRPVAGADRVADAGEPVQRAPQPQGATTRL
jgi:hypothetical protein